ncbi:electron transfer flavoprotein subunit alpha/FixB family protein [Levilactobacillus bambusae]|uniref:Electron transfer flavoprotein subunit alpha/FixB family protein n=1 Tax=Levilactobacillus bambusae TaxID=2024736 RepID=A0A2V1N2I1_9LACO|nr:electron transfer flavoprotein subunit alpha/FixB family protein [Levilactobacillus bambusae]PWG00370.1 electron transfer flavoprotein subunit alpha/FixB family protein [Levilactobacillus bambusae]
MTNESIWVYIQLNQDKIEPTSLQLLTKAKQIAEDKPVWAILLEPTTLTAEATIQQYGPDNILRLRDDRFAAATDEELADALEQVVTQYNPNSFLFPATTAGRSLAPRLQAKLQTGLTADCLDLAFDGDTLVQVKPTYGDNIMCDIICPDRRPQMATVRPNIFKAVRVPNSQTEVVSATFTFHPETTMTILNTTRLISQTASLSDAQTVIALGRGANQPKTIELARQLAAKMGGVVGVTRPLTDDPQFTHDQQIGQSGQTVAPDLLINLGISGAVQYTVGIQNANRIVSVNTDATAPIFADSDYGYVGDATEFLEGLLAQVK